MAKDRLEKGRRDQFPKVDGIGPNEGLAGVGQTKKNPKRGEMGRFDLQPFKKMRPKKKIHQFLTHFKYLKKTKPNNYTVHDHHTYNS